MTWYPTREVMIELPEGRYVRTVTDGEEYGLEFFNGEGRTRAKLSPEATRALLTGLNTLAAGGGDTIEYEWKLVKPPMTFGYEESGDHLKDRPS